MQQVLMFVNGQAMRDGKLNDALSSARFVGPATTARSYKFYSVRDEFPGLYPVDEGGAAVVGELYEVTYAELRQRLLPREPAELELRVIELADGSGTLSMIMREEALDLPDVVDISDYGGWREYMNQMQPKSQS